MFVHFSLGPLGCLLMLLLCWIAAAAAAAVPSASEDSGDSVAGDTITTSSDQYHSNEDVLEAMQAVHLRCPNITRLFALSETSVNGQPLTLIEFSSHPGHHYYLHPEVRLVANMHGNEILGRELLVRLMYDLCDRYLAEDLNVQRLINVTRVHILPSMNPDGWERAATFFRQFNRSHELVGRFNNNSIDLNRNFPDLQALKFQNLDDLVYDSHGDFVQPETRAMIRLIVDVPFTLAANFHGGDLVVSYPFDQVYMGFIRSPDEQVFRSLAAAYADKHEDMAVDTRERCENSEDFGKKHGITNGADWYEVKGGMQDFSYFFSNCFEVTIELGCEKFTPKSKLQSEWRRNERALYSFLWQAHIGIKGFVYDVESNVALSGATIHTTNITNGLYEDNMHDLITFADGDYYRLLTPGIYKVTAFMSKYDTVSKIVTVQNKPFTEALRVDFPLRQATVEDLENELFARNSRNDDYDEDDLEEYVMVGDASLY